MGVTQVYDNQLLPGNERPFVPFLKSAALEVVDVDSEPFPLLFRAAFAPIHVTSGVILEFDAVFLLLRSCGLGVR